MLHRFLLEQPTENFVPAICSRNKLSGFQVAAGAQEEIAIPSRFFLSSPPNCDRVFYRMENKTLGGF